MVYEFESLWELIICYLTVKYIYRYLNFNEFVNVTFFKIVYSFTYHTIFEIMYSIQTPEF